MTLSATIYVIISACIMGSEIPYFLVWSLYTSSTWCTMRYTVYPGLVSCPFYTVPTINPWHACTARVTVLGLCVCMFVCLLATTILALQATRRFMGDTNSFSAVYIQGHRKSHGDFAETIVFERYGVKTSRKGNMHNQRWLTSTGFSPFSAP